MPISMQCAVSIVSVQYDALNGLGVRRGAQTSSGRNDLGIQYAALVGTARSAIMVKRPAAATCRSARAIFALTSAVDRSQERTLIVVPHPLCSDPSAVCSIFTHTTHYARVVIRYAQ